MDDIQDFEDPSTLDDPAAIALDRTLTARAFRSLPDRWQSVLWYTEVEGMDPHEVAPILGMSANGVAALSYRAREGLRKAWLQAHVSEPGASDACKWTMSRLGESARHSLAARDLEKVNEHLATCTKCAIISEEVNEVGSHLAMVMVPILLGGIAGGAFLAALGHGGAAAAATTASAAGAATLTSATIPAVPASFSALAAPAVAAPIATAGVSIGAATGVTALVGSLAVVAAIGGGVVAGPAAAPTDHSASNSSNSSSQHSSSSSTSGSGSDSGSSSGVPAQSILGSLTNGSSGSNLLTDPGSGLVGGLGTTLGSTLGNTVGGVTNDVGTVTKAVGTTTKKVVGGVTKKVVDPIVKTVTPGKSPPGQAAPGGSPVTTNVTLGGKGTPGATVAAQAGGVVYGTAKVGSDGKFTLQVDALPKGTALSLSQKLTVLGVTVPLDIPLSIDTGGLGIVIHLLN